MGKYGIGERFVDYDGDEGVIIGKRKGERQLMYDSLDFSQDRWFSKCFIKQPKPLKIKPGKYYKVEGGAVIGPMRARDDQNEHYPWRVDGGPCGTLYYRDDGSCNLGSSQSGYEHYQIVKKAKPPRRKKMR